MTYLSLLFVICLGDNSNLEASVSRLSLGIENFGKDGVDQFDFLGEPLPKSWYTSGTIPSPKLHNYSLPNQLSFSDKQSYDMIHFYNPYDTRLEIVVRRFDPESGIDDDTIERFLIQLAPGEQLNVNFLYLNYGGVDIYSMMPITATLSNFASLTTDTLESVPPSLKWPKHQQPML